MNQIVYLLLDGNNRYDVSGDRVRIGSANDNEIVVSAEIISAHHVEIFREGRRWFLRDLNSTYGVWMNGTRIPAGEKQQLMNEDEIQLSQALRIRFMIERAESSATFRLLPAQPPSLPDSPHSKEKCESREQESPKRQKGKNPVKRDGSFC